MEFNGETQNKITKKVKYWCGVFFLRKCCLYLDFWYVSLSTSISAWASWKWQMLNKSDEYNVEICQLLTTSQKDVILARVKVWCYNHLYDIICKYLCDVLLWHTHKTRLWLPYLLASLVGKIGLNCMQRHVKTHF